MRAFPILLSVCLFISSISSSAAAGAITLTEFIEGGEITLPFGAARQGRGAHRGVDVAAPIGTPIQSPGAALVLEATDLFRDQPLYGKTVVLRFDEGFTAWFTHLDNYSVQPGERISVGDTFATVGRATARHGSHVHIEAFVTVAGFEFRVDPASKLPFLQKPGVEVRSDVEAFYRSGRPVSYPGYAPQSFAEIYTGNGRKEETSLTGLLFLPDGTSGKAPAVILQHGSGDPNGLDAWWRDLVPALNKAGLAAFIANSYDGRNMGETTGDQSTLSRAARASDVLMAFEAIGALDEIDADRIGVTGYSGGGAATYDSADERAAHALLGDGPRLAAHLSFYPNCILREDPKLTGAPIHMLLGAEDDYTPFGPCLAMIEEFKTAGYPASVDIYDGVGHGFIKDRTLFLPNAMTARDCPSARLGKDGYFDVDGLTDRDKGWRGYVISVMRTCGTRGVHVSGTRESRQRALQDTIQFFKQHL